MTKVMRKEARHTQRQDRASGVPLEILEPVFLPGESPWTEEPGGLQTMGSQKVGHS